MDSSIDWELLGRYLAGLCTPEEREAFERWVAADEARADLVAMMRRAWEASGTLPPQLDVDAAWKRVSERVGIRPPADGHRAATEPSQPRILPFRESRAHPRPQRRFARAAAAVVGLAVGAALWQLAVRPEPATDPFAAARTYTTRPGQRAELRLPDGTRVVLSVASTLRVPDSYGDRSRSVALEGEAYFEVTHDEARPFRVHTAHAVATDLGTRFGVRAYAGDAVTVVVREGAVSLRPAAPPAGSPDARPRPDAAAAQDSVVLAPGDLGRVDTTGRVTAERAVAIDDHLAWTDGRLVLADVPLAQAIVQLNRWYDIDIRLADDSLGSLRITGEFAAEPISEVLRFLTAPLGLEYDREGRVITLRPN